MLIQRYRKHLESGEATLSSKASPRCGCKAKGLCTRSEISYEGAEDILLR